MKNYFKVLIVVSSLFSLLNGMGRERSNFPSLPVPAMVAADNHEKLSNKGRNNKKNARVLEKNIKVIKHKYWPITEALLHGMITHYRQLMHAGQEAAQRVGEYGCQDAKEQKIKNHVFQLIEFIKNVQGPLEESLDKLPSKFKKTYNINIHCEDIDYDVLHRQCQVDETYTPYWQLGNIIVNDYKFNIKPDRSAVKNYKFYIKDCFTNLEGLVTSNGKSMSLKIKGKTIVPDDRYNMVVGALNLEQNNNQEEFIDESEELVESSSL